MPEVSTQSIQAFIDRFFDTYNKKSLLKKIFGHYRSYKESKDKHPYPPDPDNPLTTGRYAIKRIEDKEDFFHFPPGFGSHYAEDLAWMGEFYIFLHFSRRAKKFTINQITEFLKLINDLENLNEFIILISGEDAITTLGSRLTKVNDKELNLLGYYGDYSNGHISIPVFKLEALRRQNLIVAINKNHLGTITQYPPNDIEKGETNESCRDNCYVKIEPLTENSELMQQLLRNPPEWLQKQYVSTQARKEYLSKHVYVEIRERFHYFEDPNLEVYLSEWM